jgi:hypothetical protein
MPEVLIHETTCYYQTNASLEKESVVQEAELARMIAHRAVRQLVLTPTPDGWTLQILPKWEHRLLTLVSLRKEIRHYKDVDRLFRTIRKHGPLPPALFLGDTS